ncbi:MAG: xanthine dehydrogenase family protein molybdopterin-binding subunit [Egibacteraceae bacterium]
MTGQRGGYVGASVPRGNDAALVTGAGRFIDDIYLPRLAYAVVVRSPIAHGRLVSCDTRRLRDGPLGAAVLDVITPPDAAGLAPLPCVSRAPGQRQTGYPVLSETVRYVGQPVALVVATTRGAAEDAAELVHLDFAELPAVTDAAAALAADAPLLYPEWGTNVACDFEIGDPGAECAAAIATAAHVIALELRIGRVAPAPMEPRGVVAGWDPALGQLTMWTSTQAPHHVRDHLAPVLGLGSGQVRVIAPGVGGGFGAKEHLYPDEALVCLAALRLGRPVKWIETRGEHFTATMHARDATHHARLALDADGGFVALHTDVVGNLGAHMSNVGASPLAVSGLMLPGPYRFERAGARVRGVVTNTTPTGSYRGFGQPEATWVRERLIDEAARRLGVDPVKLRHRNMIPPGELPYTTRTWQRYDSGDYPAALERVAELAAARPRGRHDGRRRGVGFACHVEMTGMGPSEGLRAAGIHAGGYESAVVRMEPDATVTLSAGVCDMGQGIATTLAQLAADRLGVPIADVRVTLGDTATAPYSPIGSIASRSVTVGGAAVAQSAQRLRERLLAIAAHQLEADVADLELVDGAIRARDDPSARLTLRELAESAWLGWDLPEGMAPGLEERGAHDPPAYTYAYAAHAAAVAVDPETGSVEVEGYWLVNDSGVAVNPMIVTGQLHGGVVQGIGMALAEHVAYDAAGQPLTTTFADCPLPGAADVPDLCVELTQTPSPVTPGGMKGVGEAGVISAPAAIGNAVAAALPEIADQLTATPLTPGMLWALLHQRRSDH